MMADEHGMFYNHSVFSHKSGKSLIWKLPLMAFVMSGVDCIAK
jgi:hypothetical protein